jgi:TPP-dependent pyruvate/acetoin dehydrogenase alpha subunit
MTTTSLMKEINKAAPTLSQIDRLNLYFGMLLTRALDNAQKQLFLSGENLYQGSPFQGKGFRSLGQEAIYGAFYFMHRGKAYVKNGAYCGDVAAPLIRDLGVFFMCKR